MKFQRLIAPLLLAAAYGCAAVHAQPTARVVVDSSWARVTLQGQQSSVAFMRLTAPKAMRLVRVESPAAGVSELHEMKMDGDVMRMRALSGLDLPAGTPVELKPGGYHVMLMDLKAPLLEGGTLPLTLVFQDANGAEHRQPVQVPVAAVAPSSAGYKMQGVGGTHGEKHAK